MKERKKENTFNIKNIAIGIFILLISFFFLFTEQGKNIFIPLESFPEFLHFYYYLISYALIALAAFFILRGLGIIKR